MVRVSYIAAFIIIGALTLAAIIFYSRQKSDTEVETRLENAKNQNTPSPEKFITVGEQKIIVDLADTEAKSSKGLGGRESLEDGTGMLFVFPAKKIRPPFWMKGMKIPLDIVWIADDKVTQITADVQPPEQGISLSSLKLYLPDDPIDYVLEVPAGYAQRAGIEVGDSVTIH